jgi:hypothetical protein
MAEHKIVYLIIQRDGGESKQTFWRMAGYAYPCRDGSLNLKLDFHPGLVFNVRNPKSNGERKEVGQPEANGSAERINDDDIPF